MTDCANAPTTFVEWDTATVSQVAYTAVPVTWTFDLQTGTISIVYSYPSLIVTQFTPGELINDVSIPGVDISDNL